MQLLQRLITAGLAAGALIGGSALAQSAPELTLTRFADCGTPQAPTEVNQRFSDTWAHPGLKVQFTYSCYLIKHGDEYLLWDTGEPGGAALMIQDGALANPKPDAIFGLHVAPGEPGRLAWRPGPMMAADDSYQITLKGRQTHGANPWAGIDIASMAADIVQAFNQIAARQIKVTVTPTILSVTTIHGGLRYNIIPDDLTMTGTLRSFDPTLRKEIMARAEKAVASISERYGGSGRIAWGPPNPVTSNDPSLTARMKPTLARAARGDIKDDIEYITGAEDFAFYQQAVPGLFYDLGIGFPAGVNHSPMFNVMDERALEVGVRAQALLALDFLATRAAGP